MAGIVKFPDGNHFSAGWMSAWNSTGAFGVAGKPNIRFAGFFISTEYTYTDCPNSTVAERIIALLDTWMFSDQAYLDIAKELGMAIYTLSPDNGVAASSFDITIAGQQFTAGSTVTIGVQNYPAAFTDSGTLTISYAGELAVGVYDVTLTSVNGATFILPQSLTLT